MQLVLLSLVAGCQWQMEQRRAQAMRVKAFLTATLAFPRCCKAVQETANRRSLFAHTTERLLVVLEAFRSQWVPTQMAVAQEHADLVLTARSRLVEQAEAQLLRPLVRLDLYAPLATVTAAGAAAAHSMRTAALAAQDTSAVEAVGAAVSSQAL